ncbi:type VI secretion system Vgr family protein [Providencia huaxiensis]|uniref:type VI secretion system Vgr family protein n=1 Tax=Providencia huaxiensis TaxID=2027290 RepID=UPI0034E5DE0A
MDSNHFAKTTLLEKIGIESLSTGLVFTCEIGGFPSGTFLVTEFTLTEGLSTLYTLNLSVVSLLPFIDFQSHLGRASSLTVKRDGQIIRTVNGLLSSGVQGNTDGVKTWYHFEIRPEMWVMTLNQDSRIFQNKTTPDILKILLDEAHIKSDCIFYRKGLHQPRPYTTQKRESAYEFWCRLAAEEGITFWFEENQLFYSDEHMGMTAGIHLTYNPQSDTDITDSTASVWRYGESLCSDQLIQKDNNYIRPSYPLMHEQYDERKMGQHSVFESYGRFQLDDEGRPLTQARFEQLQSGRRAGTAITNCFALRPGKIFTLTNHPHEPMNDSWQVVAITHRGVQPLADNGGGEGTQLSNNVSFIPGREEWRPPYRYKPTADGDEIATVVGPPGEEIYVNEYGAIKVHFHWDRYGKPDHGASCWVRVAMNWSGGGYGFSAVPRIGTQVLITYIGGDLDRPMVVGCTYDGRNRPPLSFPDQKTQTTFRTKTHKGSGFNELRFDDDNGREEVFIHAQKDMNTYVLNDRTTEVNHDHSEWVKHDQSLKVDHDVTEEIGHQRSTVIGDNDTLVTKGYRHRETEKNESLNVKGQQTLTIGKSQFIDITGDQKVMVGRHIELRAKSGEIVIANAGGHIIIDPQGNIKIEGASVSINQLGGGGALSDAIYDYSAGFVLKNESTGQPLKQTLYKITSSDGQEVIGKTDAAGRTAIVQTQSAEPLTLQLAETPSPKKERYFRVSDNTEQEYIMEFKEEQ